MVRRQAEKDGHGFTLSPIFRRFLNVLKMVDMSEVSDRTGEDGESSRQVEVKFLLETNVLALVSATDQWQRTFPLKASGVDSQQQMQ